MTLTAHFYSTMKSKIILLVAAILLTAVGLRAERLLLVSFADKSTATFDVHPGMEIALDNHNLHISSPVLQDAPLYELSDIEKFQSLAETTATDLITSPNPGIRFNGNTIEVYGAGEGIPCIISDMTGRKVLCRQLLASDRVELSGLAPGVYIVNIGRTSIRYRKQ